jgi:hypothetical protein
LERKITSDLIPRDKVGGEERNGHRKYHWSLDLVPFPFSFMLHCILQNSSKLITNDLVGNQLENYNTKEKQYFKLDEQIAPEYAKHLTN